MREERVSRGRRGERGKGEGEKERGRERGKRRGGKEEGKGREMSRGRGRKEGGYSCIPVQCRHTCLLKASVINY